MKAPETVEDRTRLTLNRLKITSPRFLRRWMAESLRNSQKILAEQSHASWVPWQSLTSFFKPTSSDLFRSRSGIIQEQWFWKPGNHRGSFLWYSSYYSGPLNSPETENYPHIVTGGPEGTRQYPHMTTETQKEMPYCSPRTSSEKQKKARSISQPQFRSETTPATIEAD